MPKTPIDYSKGLIYSIVCKTNETLIYIGSTTNFRQRKTHHKTACYCENNRCHNFQVYVMIRSNGGWTNFKISPVKEYACENNIQLLIEEERIRKEIQANLNTRRAFRTEEEAKEEANERAHKYYESHTAEIKEYHKIYNEENKARIKERQQKYHEANKEESNKKRRENLKANNEEINKKRRENRLAKKLSSATIV